ncbi:ABC transporter ATP-binding protein [Nonomuraea sp. NPDC049400]|uniref:ABC transporter ATP-binding protein n=1 Tax=Nonomuraea sp. NPDC049400 TaxID=3364352 RepID=UPI0037A05426
MTLRFIWRLIARHPWVYSGLLLCLGLFLVGRLIPGFMERAFFDALTHQAEAAWNPWSIVALMVSLELARLMLSLGGAITDATVQYSSARLIQGNLMRRILRRPGAVAVRDSPSATLSRFRDDVQDIIVFLTAPVTLLGTLVFSVIAVWMMIQISLQLTLVVVLPLVAVIAAATVANARVQRYRLDSREATARITGFLGELFGAAQLVKLYGAERHMLRRFGELNDQRQRAAVKDGVFTQVLNSIFYNAVDLGIGLVLLLAAAPMVGGEFSVGDFALFDYYLFFVTRLPLTMGQTMVQYRQAAVAADRLMKLGDLADPAELTRDVAGSAPAPDQRAQGLRELKVTGLSYRYPSSEGGITDVSLVLQHGSFTVVTGRVGSGKTTLLRALLGLVPRDGGVIHWNGEEIEDPSSFLVPPRAAYTPQTPRLCSDTVRDNILLGLAEDDVDLSTAIHSAALDHDLREAVGLDTMVGPRGAKLSGGQVQRLALARMLVRDSDLLVVDDLASALDTETERKVIERLRGGREGRTFLVTSHRAHVLEQADRIIVLRDGMVHAEGTLPELLADCQEMRDLWREFTDEQKAEGETACAG